jgi:hypothetical protein
MVKPGPDNSAGVILSLVNEQSNEVRGMRTSNMFVPEIDYHILLTLTPQITLAASSNVTGVTYWPLASLIIHLQAFCIDALSSVHSALILAKIYTALMLENPQKSSKFPESLINLLNDDVTFMGYIQNDPQSCSRWNWIFGNLLLLLLVLFPEGSVEGGK